MCIRTIFPYQDTLKVYRNLQLWLGPCIVIFGKTFNSHSASLHPDAQYKWLNLMLVVTIKGVKITLVTFMQQK